MTASTGQGTITAATTNEKKHDATKHFYETRLVKIIGQTATTMTSSFERTTMRIEMKTAQKWPTYTENISTLNYRDPTLHFSLNMGFRNNTTITLRKSTTKFLYQTNCDQAWDCRQIV